MPFITHGGAGPWRDVESSWLNSPSPGRGQTMKRYIKAGPANVGRWTGVFHHARTIGGLVSFITHGRGQTMRRYRHFSIASRVRVFSWSRGRTTKRRDFVADHEEA